MVALCTPSVNNYLKRNEEYGYKARKKEKKYEENDT
jgi:hypothetical protein